MNPFKGVCGRRKKRKSKCAIIEVKQEPGIKEEPRDDDVMDIPQPRIDGRYRVNYQGPVDFDYYFDQIKDETKCEKEEAGKDKDSTSCERSDESAASDDENEEPMSGVMDVQPHKPVGIGKKQNESSKRRNKRTIPRNQADKKQKKHKCHVCNHLASYKSELIRHLRIHTGEKPFQCDICSKSFSQKVNLNNQKKTHGQFRCSKCNQGFEQESDKIDHERLCSSQQLECDFCGYHTVVKSSLTVHMQTHSGVKPFVCSICFKSFATNSDLLKHSMAHKDELPNACSKCRRRFVTPEEKQVHETRCQRSLFACNQCHYKTVHKRSLKWHMQSKQFVEPILLKRHLSSTHSDQFPFQCSKCFGGYASEDEKIAHEDSCGHRRYQCHLCKELSRSKQYLKIHMRKDHTGERIQCKVCAVSFVQKGHADRHMKTVHHLVKK